MADDAEYESDDNPFSFNSFVQRSSQVLDDDVDVKRDTYSNKSRSRFSYQDQTNTPKVDLFDEDDEGNKTEENPFSFKEFIKKDKREGIYISGEDGSDEWGEDMGNQNGTVPPSPQQESPVDGRPNQRRATSPGLPSRHKQKPTAKTPQSEASGTATPPSTPKKPGAKTDRPTGQSEGDFVDFIYDYATQNSKDGVPEGTKANAAQRRARNGARYSFGDTDAPPLPEKKLYARERARAHTHGHPVRKHKNGPSKQHPKSQLVVDYIDATGDDVNMFTTVSASDLLSQGNDSSPVLDDLPRPKAQSEVKPHRERARAHSHGQRKNKSGENKARNRGGIEEYDREGKYSQKTGENGSTTRQEYDRKPSPARKDILCDDLKENPVKSQSVPDILAEPYDTLPPRNRSPSPGNPSSMSSSPAEDGGSPDVSPDTLKLKQENSRLRRELAEARKISDKDAKRIETMEEELKRLRLREAEDAKTLEAMVQHVEANLKRTTERAVSAENTIATLKKEIKSLKSENSTLLSENKNFKEGKETLELKEKAHVASQKLAGAAKDAEANLKQLMAGVDVLKLMAETLACFEKITEPRDDNDKKGGKKGFGTAL